MNRAGIKIFLVSLLTFQSIYPADGDKSAKPSQSKLRPSSYIVPEQHKDNPWATGIIDGACALGALFAVATGFVHKDQIRSVLPDVSGLWRSARSSASVAASKVSVSSSAIKQGAVCTTATCAGGAAGWFLRGSQTQSQPEAAPQTVELQDTQTVEEIMGQLPLTDQERDEERGLMATDFLQARKKCVGFVNTLVQELHGNHATITRLEEQKNEIAGQRDALEVNMASQKQAQVKAEKALVRLAVHIGKHAGLNSTQVASEIHPEGDPDKVAAHGIRYMGVLLQNHEAEKRGLLGEYEKLSAQHTSRLHEIVEGKAAVVLELDRQRLQTELATKGLKSLAKRIASSVVPVDKRTEVCEGIEDQTESAVIVYDAQVTCGLIEEMLVEFDRKARQGDIAQKVLDAELLLGLPKKDKEDYLKTVVTKSQQRRAAVEMRTVHEIMSRDDRSSAAGVAAGSRVELK